MDRVDGWHEFYVAAEGAAATLTGLVFVALSLHLRHVLSKPQLQYRAYVTLGGLTAVILIAAVALVPDQTPRTMGIVAAAAAAAQIAAAPFGVRMTGASGRRVDAALIVRLGLSVVALSLSALAAFALLTDRGSGLLFLAASAILTLGWCIWNAWDLLASAVEAT